jgi:indole-3-glycerol phosphate synthase
MRLAGVDAVLLIAAALSPARLVELHAAAALGPALPAGAVLVAESGLTPPDLPVKVCGLTRLVDARLAWDLGAMPPTSTGSPSSAK